jgi:hypothetical protein
MNVKGVSWRGEPAGKGKTKAEGEEGVKMTESYYMHYENKNKIMKVIKNCKKEKKVGSHL